MFNFQGSVTLLSTFVTISCATSTCNRNINRNGTQKLYHDRCISGEIIGAAYGLSLLDCVENCIRTKGCASFQYSRALFRCLKSSKNISTDIPKEVCRGEVSSAREDWTKGFPDPCQSADCLTGALCKFDLHGNVSTCEVPETCELPLTNRLNEQNIQDVCNAYGGRKVRFMSKKTLQKLITLDNVCRFREELVVRLKMINKEQKEVLLAQHSMYKSMHNLTFLLNNYKGFNRPRNDTVPYFYLGFLPTSTAERKDIQGYRANGKDFSFSNTDGHPNSYIVFYAGERIISFETDSWRNEFMMGWINQSVPAKQNLLDDYFMQFDMHMGGGGGRMTPEVTGSVAGAAVGCIVGP